MTREDCGFPDQGDSACRGCGIEETCGLPANEPTGPFRGVSLVVASAVYFGAPVLLALIGAAMATESPLSQLAGGGGGLLIGMCLTTWTARRWGRGKEVNE